MKKLTIILSLALLSAMGVKASTCVALCSGNWESSSTWSCGQMPNCGDSAYIPAGIIITVTAVDTYTCTPMKLTIAGELDFQTGKKLDLSCGSVIVGLPGAIVNPGNGGGSSNIIAICGVNYWNAGQGNAYGPFCWGCPGNLPIVLKYFYADCKGSEVALSWSTASEISNRYFTVERSQDGMMWADMAQINGAGTTSAIQYYAWTDGEPLAGTSYYRLKQTDYDGHCVSLSMAASSCSNSAAVIIYPNPSVANGIISCGINSSSQQAITFTVVDRLGRCMSNSTATVGEGFSTQQITSQNLKPGTYILKVSFGDGSAPVRKPIIVTE